MHGYLRVLLLTAALSFAALLSESLSVRTARIAFSGDFLFSIIPLVFLGLACGSIAATLFKKKTPLRSLAWGFFGATLLQYTVVHFAHTSPYPELIQAMFFISSFLAYVCVGWIMTAIIIARASAFTQLYSIDLFSSALGALAGAFLLNAIGYESTITFLVIIALIPALVISSTRPLSLASSLVCITGFTIAAFMWPLATLITIPCSNGEIALYRTSNAFSNLIVDARHINSEKNVRAITLDCGGGSAVQIFEKQSDGVALLRDLNSLAFAFAASTTPFETVLVTGAGGGMDVWRAHLMGAQHVIATELNEKMIDATRALSGETYNPYSQKGVALFLGDTRRFVETTPQKFDVIVVANSTHYGEQIGNLGTISYAQSTEAFMTMLAKLAPGGVLAVIKQTAPLYGTPIIPALKRSGIPVSGRIAYVVSPDLNLALVKPAGFDAKDLELLAHLSAERKLPPPEIISGNSSWLKDSSNYTDDIPYPWVRESRLQTQELLRPITLFITIIVLATLFLVARMATRNPLAAHLPRRIILLYITASAAIGFGYIIAELGVSQKIMFIASDFSYTTSLLLASFLISSVIAIQLSRRITDSQLPLYALLMLLPILLITLTGMQYEHALLHALLPLTLTLRITAVTFLMLLFGVVCGFYFPLIMRMARSQSEKLVPWIWMTDALFGILAGIFAKFAFHAYGLTLTFPLTFCAFFLAAICIHFAKR